MLRKRISFIPSRGVHPRDLDTGIAIAMGWKRHSGVEDKDCFCGINIVTSEGQKALQVVWTDDGESGYVKDLTPQEEEKIRAVLSSHRRGV